MRLLRSPSIGFVLGLAVWPACESERAPAESAVSRADVVATWSEAGLAQYAHVQAVLAQALEHPIPSPPSSVRDLPVSLPVDDVVVIDREAERPGNARILSLADLLGVPELVPNLTMDNAIRRTQTWAELSYRGTVVRDVFQTAIRAVTAETPPTGDAADAFAATLEEFATLKYLVVLRQAGYVAPEVVGEQYRPGAFGGDLLVFELATERLLGQLPVIASTSEGDIRVFDDRARTALTSDLRANVRDRIDAVLAEAQQNVTAEPVVAVPAPPSPHEEALAACAANDAAACTRAAGALWSGEGMAQNRTEAVTLYDRGCELGEPGACAVMGTVVRDGELTAQDYARARTLFGRACDGASMLGCKELGILLLTGRGGDPDYATAYTVLERACGGGEQGGCVLLGLIYHEGLGVAVDLDRARQYYRGACDAGFAPACERAVALEGGP